MYIEKQKCICIYIYTSKAVFALPWFPHPCLLSQLFRIWALPLLASDHRRFLGGVNKVGSYNEGEKPLDDVAVFAHDNDHHHHDEKKGEGITFTIKQVGVNHLAATQNHLAATVSSQSRSEKSCPFMPEIKFPVACTNLCDLAVTKMEPWWNHGWLGVPNQNRKSGRQFSIPTSRVRKIIIPECCLRIRYNQGWMNLPGCKITYHVYTQMFTWS